MRIAMFTNNYKPFIGGVPISIERLSNGLRKLGREVVVFAPDYGVCETEEHVVRYKTIYQKNRDGLMIGNCFDSKIERQFLEGRFDVIHVHHPMISGFAALYLEKKYGIPVAYTYHTRYEDYLHYIGFLKPEGKGEDLEAAAFKTGAECSGSGIYEMVYEPMRSGAGADGGDAEADP